MMRYMGQRLVLILPTLVLVSIVVFLLVRWLPGDAVELTLDQNAVTYKGDAAKLRHDLGLDQPAFEQYGHWMSGIARGDFGRSLWTKQPIAREIRSRLAVSLLLGAMAVAFGITIGIPIGTFAAVRHDTPLDYLLRGFTVLWLAVPGFWLGTMMVVFSSKYFGWSPSSAFVRPEDNILLSIRSLILPAIALGLASGATIMRFVRTQMLEVLSQDYIRTARAKGLTGRSVIMRHALRNALVPAITVIGLQVPVLIGGSVIMETIFSLPGMGSFMVDAVRRRDYPVIQMVNLVFASFVIIVNLVVDLSYCLVDPRISFGER